MKYFITESQLKKFVKSQFGLDLTDKIHMVTNKWELPLEFEHISPRALNNYLNNFGPMYVFEIGKKLYLGQNQGRKDGWTIVDIGDRLIPEFEFMKLLGIESLGLSMDDLLDQYFSEESLNEQTNDMSVDRMSDVLESYLDNNFRDSEGVKRFMIYYDELSDRFIVNIFFDREYPKSKGIAMNSMMNRATNKIGNELETFFKGIKFGIYQHFDD